MPSGIGCGRPTRRRQRGGSRGLGALGRSTSRCGTCSERPRGLSGEQHPRGPSPHGSPCTAAGAGTRFPTKRSSQRRRDSLSSGDHRVQVQDRDGPRRGAYPPVAVAPLSATTSRCSPMRTRPTPFARRSRHRRCSRSTAWPGSRSRCSRTPSTTSRPSPPSAAVPVAAGENAYFRWGFREICDRRAADYLQPDVARCGGITEFRRIAALADAYGLSLSSPLWHELSIGLVGASPERMDGRIRASHSGRCVDARVRRRRRR